MCNFATYAKEWCERFQWNFAKEWCERFQWNFPQDFSDEGSVMVHVHVMAWYNRVSHCLSQCWPRSMSSFSVTRPQRFNQFHQRILSDGNIIVSCLSNMNIFDRCYNTWRANTTKTTLQVSPLRVLMAWCFSTRTSVATVLRVYANRVTRISPLKHRVKTPFTSFLIQSMLCYRRPAIGSLAMTLTR